MRFLAQGHPCDGGIWNPHRGQEGLYPQDWIRLRYRGPPDMRCHRIPGLPLRTTYILPGSRSPLKRFWSEKVIHQMPFNSFIWKALCISIVVGSLLAYPRSGG